MQTPDVEQPMRQMFALVLIVLLIVCSSGCGSEEKSNGHEAVAVASTEASTSAQDAQPFIKPTIEGVPRLDRTVVDSAHHRKAQSHNGAALKHHKKKRWDAAIGEYTKGLEQDPGNVLIRFNLGCAYALKGDRTNALKILEQFSLAVGCVDCKGRLARATKDTDYKSLWEDPEFIELAQGVKAPEVKYKALAKRFLKNMNKAYWALMKKTADTGRSFAVNGKKSRLGDQLISGGSALARWKVKLGGKSAQMGPDMNDVSRISCKGSCCTYKYDSNDMFERVADIDTVCFDAVTSEEVLLRRVKLRDPVY